MRIVIVCSNLEVGGTETQIIALSREFVRSGHDVAIYTLNRDNPRAPELEGSGVAIVADQKRLKLDPAVVYRLRRFLKEFRADIVQGFLYDGDIYARVACAGSGIRALNSERSDNYSLNAWQTFGLWLTGDLAAGVIANSHAGAAFARKLFALPEDDVHVVWNGIALEAVESRIAACKAAYKMEFFGDSDVRVACLVGVICPSKDHLLALEVARRLAGTSPDWRVLFVGGVRRGSEDYHSQVRHRCKAAGLSARVHFAGMRQDVPEILNQCDVVFSTSVHEGFPNVVLEAMAARTPVVSTDYSDIRRILPHEWQVVEGRDPEAIVTAIRRAYDLRAAIAQEQRRWIESYATIEAAASAYIEIYGGYARKAPARPGDLRLGREGGATGKR